MSLNVMASEIAFACPVHKARLGEAFYCAACNQNYPAVDGVPILLNEANSVFNTSDYLRPDTVYGGASGYTGNMDKRSGLRQLYRRAMFRLSEADLPVRDFDAAGAVEHILRELPEARILVIGAGDTTVKGNVTYSDVSFGKNVDCIADAHDLPFVAQSFDACIACAVLEHVVDPHRCVDEIMRVLRPGGYVFAETPFMQPVHMGAYDFTRFTYLGHRRLFRYFDDIRSGISGGPGVSTAQLLRYAIAAASDRPIFKKWLKMIGLVGTFPLRWFDHVCHSHSSAYDSASGFYFFGKLREQPISDRHLLTLFRGA